MLVKSSLGINLVPATGLEYIIIFFCMFDGVGLFLSSLFIVIYITYTYTNRPARTYSAVVCTFVGQTPVDVHVMSSPLSPPTFF